MREKLIIVIPGSRTKEARNIPLLRTILNKFYHFFGVWVEGYSWLDPLCDSFRKIPAEVVLFKWSGGISPIAIRNAAKDLRTILARNSDKEIVLFTKSLGGVVAETAIRHNKFSVKKLVYVATPHFIFKKPTPKSVEVINIYSPQDRYQRLAHFVLFLGLGKVDISYGENISIHGLVHSAFNHDQTVIVRNEQYNLFDFYKQCVS